MGQTLSLSVGPGAIEGKPTEWDFTGPSPDRHEWESAGSQQWEENFPVFEGGSLLLLDIERVGLKTDQLACHPHMN